eukprot:TRINITY_DN3470_c0_g1_i1.p1 TRINITY_DN3470_c0_g1~~TRINITY_DN3470_c0_g1_i1.p1  ORF type:complete len:383 (-),score=167.07 TRINITY_DN3470_c0_g1_i1:86-1150(-)
MEVASMTLAELPEEVILQIFIQLDPKDVTNLRITCRAFYRISLDDSLWQSFFLQRYLHVSVGNSLWKNLYQWVGKLERSFYTSEQSVCDLSLQLGQKNAKIEEFELYSRKLEHENVLLEEDLNALEMCREDLESTLREQGRRLELQQIHVDHMEESMQKSGRRLKEVESSLGEAGVKVEEGENLMRNLKIENRELKKEVSEVRGILYSEQFQINKLQKENERKDRLIIKLETLCNEKTREVEVLKDAMERNMREERAKRANIERKLESCLAQLEDITESSVKQSMMMGSKQSAMEKLVDQETQANEILRKEVRRLERELKRSTEKHEFEVARLKEMIAKSNQLKALSYTIMSKA